MLQEYDPDEYVKRFEEQYRERNHIIDGLPVGKYDPNVTVKEIVARTRSRTATEMQQLYLEICKSLPIDKPFYMNTYTVPFNLNQTRIKEYAIEYFKQFGYTVEVHRKGKDRGYIIRSGKDAI